MRHRLTLIGAVLAIIATIWAIQHYGGSAPITKSDIPLATNMPETAQQKEGKYPRAKELVSPSGWINTEPLTVESLIGKKVILIDFWTYSCINCQRTLPYLKDWNAKYKDKGLLILGVHTPEFSFEKEIANVQKAVSEFGIIYPVVLDNDFGIWHAYGNQYWPHKYLIDTDGYIVYDHIGEGGYEETEKQIQKALDEHMVRIGMKGTAQGAITVPADAPIVDSGRIATPEIYLGSERNQQFLGNGETGKNGLQGLMMPDEKKQYPNAVYLSGPWNFFSEYTQSTVAGTRLRLRYTAKQINIVAGSKAPVHVRVFIDGQEKESVTISSEKLYTLFESDGYDEHLLELIMDSSGLQIFTFTFG